jgi:hypothetical protein|tara:strand:- start:859 stop:1713 length:855 start_codon:yes stop_codon:yes gene_type:complete
MSFAVVAIVGAGVAAAGSLAKLGVSLGGRRGRINEQAAAKAEMQKMKKEYRNLDTSNLAAGVRNPFENLENTFEDLTVNQKQAEFQSQQFQQSQANIMDSLSGAAGGSGIAGLAQTLANQGILSSQKASASIGMQEAQNQKMAAQQGARNQAMEGQGEMYAEKMRQQGGETARGLEYQKTSTLFGMSQQRAAAANEARRQAKSDQLSAIGDIAQLGVGVATAGAGMPKLPGTGPTEKIASMGLEKLDVPKLETGPDLAQRTPPPWTPFKAKFGVGKELKINKKK